MHHTRASLSFALLLALLASCYGSDSKAIIARDSVGNIHINTTAGQRVFVNGEDLAEKVRILSLQFADIFKSTTIGRIYIAGGMDGAVASTNVMRYDGLNWETSVGSPPLSLSRGRSHFAVVQYNNVMLFIGGTNGTHFSGTLDSFSGGRIWEYGQFGAERAYHAVAEYQTRLIVTGGHNGSPSALNLVECSDPNFISSWGRWASCTPMTVRRMRHVAVSDGNLLFVAGGASSMSGPALSSVEAYDGTKWTAVASLQTARQDSAAAFFGGSIYVIGGNDGAGSALRSVERYTGSAWVSAPPLVRPRGSLVATIFQTRLHVLTRDGSGGSSGSEPGIEMFDGTSWEARTVPGPLRAGMAAVAFVA